MIISDAVLSGTLLLDLLCIYARETERLIGSLSVLAVCSEHKNVRCLLAG